jgi:hypothetical protein
VCVCVRARACTGAPHMQSVSLCTPPTLAAIMVD